MENIVLQIVIVLGVILVSMTLHEVMHGLMAYWLGDDTAKEQGRLTLNPIKHIDPFLTVLLPIVLLVIGGPIFGGAKPVPFNPRRVRYDEFGAALVALAGPLVNLLIAFFTTGILVLFDPAAGSIAWTILVMTIQINIGFFVFNMLPIPPLDGSRVLYALAPNFVRRGMEVMEQFGLIVVFALVMFAGSLLGRVMVTAIENITRFFVMIFGGV